MSLFKKNKIVQTKRTAPEQLVWKDIQKERRKHDRKVRREDERLRESQMVMTYPKDTLRDRLRIWNHRHGHQVVGVILLAVLLCLGYVGYRQAHPKTMTYEEMLGVDDLDLSYEVTVEGFDGEMFSYSLYFSDDPDDVQTAQRLNGIMSRIAQRMDGDVYYGDIFPYIDEDRKVQIVLDLGNAEDESMVSGILEALEGTEGLERVVVNEGADEYGG